MFAREACLNTLCLPFAFGRSSLNYVLVAIAEIWQRPRRASNTLNTSQLACEGSHWLLPSAIRFPPVWAFALQLTFHCCCPPRLHSWLRQSRRIAAPLLRVPAWVRTAVTDRIGCRADQIRSDQIRSLPCAAAAAGSAIGYSATVASRKQQQQPSLDRSNVCCAGVAAVCSCSRARVATHSLWVCRLTRPLVFLPRPLTLRFLS